MHKFLPKEKKKKNPLQLVNKRQEEEEERGKRGRVGEEGFQKHIRPADVSKFNAGAHT